MKTKLFKQFALPLVICFALCACFLTACQTKPDYLSYVSELRKDIFVGSQDNFAVVVYSGSKENPAIFDGIKNPTSLSLTFKVTQLEDCGEQLTVKFEIANKNYSKQLQFNPVKSTLSCDVEVASLPEESLTVQICYGENVTTVNTFSKLNKNTVSYVDALNKAIKKAQTFLTEHTDKGVLNAEIVLRLLCENDRNYYYVGFVCEEGLKLAYLINGETGEIIAEKKN